MPPRPTCPYCGSAVSAEARYCDHCGTPLSSQGPVPSRRQTRSPGRIAVWVFSLITVLVFGAGMLGGFRYQARGWPLVSDRPAAASAPSERSDPPPARPDGGDAALSLYMRSVVSIRVQGEQGSKTGSGFLMDAAGHIVTAAHVVDGVKCLTVTDSRGQAHTGTVLERDGRLDTALLSVPTLRNAAAYLDLGASARLAPGAPAYVMGSPGGTGSVTHLNASVGSFVHDQRIGDRYFKELIQLSNATVVEGFSGGPLVEQASGRVVGIVNAGSSGPIAYAVPMDTVAATLREWAAMPSTGSCPAEAVGRTVPAILATVTPLSGSYGVLGADLADGAELALRDMEADLRRVGYEVTLKRYDDQGNVRIGADRAGLAEYDQDVFGVVGSLDSQVTAGVAGVLRSSGLVMVAPVAGAEELTSHGWPHLNRLVVNARRQEQAAARFLQQRLQAQAVFLLDDGSPDAIARAAAFEKAAQVISLPVAGRARVSPTADWADVKQGLTAARADAIFYAGQSETAAKALQALRQDGVTVPFLGGEGLYDNRMAGLTGQVLQSVYFTYSTAEAGDRFRKHFESVLGKPTRGYAAYGYDAARIILEALVRYGESNPARIPPRNDLAALVRKTRGYPGWSTPVTFDDVGENRTSSVYLFEWLQGQPALREQLQ